MNGSANSPVLDQHLSTILLSELNTSSSSSTASLLHSSSPGLLTVEAFWVTQPEFSGCIIHEPNRTTWGNDSQHPDGYECISITPLEAVVCVFLAILIVAIIIGNVFVILSVLIFDKMRTLSNGLIVSLASADLLVAIIVLPISLQYEVIGRWTLGPYVCDLWITSDVFCCTASILNIVVIALDRYWLITRHVRYTHSAVLPRRKVCFVMLSLAWIVAALISTSPLLGWRQGTEKENPSKCLISQDYSYTIFSTFGAFWLPLVVILAVYFKIFHFARQRVTRRTKPYEQTYAEASIAIDQCNEAVSPQEQLTVVPFPGKSQNSGSSNSPTRPPLSANGDVESPPPPRTVSRFQFSTATTTTGNDPEFRPVQVASRGVRNRSRSMRRSARTLGLIIGGFLVCWMPFFLVATVDPFCKECHVPRIVRSFVLWLGYSNSLLNPAIYAIWDKTFRRSFKRLGSCDIR